MVESLSQKDPGPGVVGLVPVEITKSGTKHLSSVVLSLEFWIGQDIAHRK